MEIFNIDYVTDTLQNHPTAPFFSPTFPLPKTPRSEVGECRSIHHYRVIVGAEHAGDNNILLSILLQLSRRLKKPPVPG